ncbi:MAG: carbohydrate-binding protein, partial [Opitutales bacterium]|nr:carbohydrate-binding protein [Opitutales bacterium]
EAGSFELKAESPAQDLYEIPFDDGNAWYDFDGNGDDAVGSGTTFTNTGDNVAFDTNSPAEGSHSLSFMGNTNEEAYLSDNSVLEPGTGDFAIAGWVESQTGNWILDKGNKHLSNSGYSVINHHEAENLNENNGVEVASDRIHYIDPGDWVGYHNISFGSGIDMIRLRYGSYWATGNIEVRLDNPNGQLLANFSYSPTGSVYPGSILTLNIGKISGTRHVYLKFPNGNPTLDWIEFCYSGHSDGTGYGLKSDSGLSFNLRNGSSTRSVSKALDVGWNFFVLNMDRDGDMKMYVNGTDAPGSTSILDWQSVNFDNSLHLRLGKGFQSDDSFNWQGKLDNLRFYNRLLTTEEINLLYTEVNPEGTGNHYVKTPIENLEVHYAVLEKGEYNSAEHGFDGEVLEKLSAGTDYSGNWTGEDLGVLTTFSNPVVTGQVTSFADPSPSVYYTNVATVASEINLSHGKPTAQISTLWGAGSHIAVDGVYDNPDSLTITDVHDQPWWYVDLGSVQRIDEIRIWNAMKWGAGSRLYQFDVTVHNSLSDPPVWQIFYYENVYTYSMQVGVNGRYIKLQKRAGNTSINFNELQAIQYVQPEIKVGKHVGEDPDTTRADEQLGVLVLESGSGTIGSTEYVAGLSSKSVQGADDSAPYNINFSGLTEGAEVAILSGYGTDNPDGSWPVLYDNAGLTDTQLKVFMDEDRMLDVERSGPAEQVSYVVFGQTTDWLNLDNDADGIPDYWERRIVHGDANDAINGYVDVLGSDDFDADGLRNEVEYHFKSSPLLADTDNDGFTDRQEYFAATSATDDSDHPNVAPDGAIPPNLDEWQLHSLGLTTGNELAAFKEDTELRLASSGNGLGSSDAIGYLSQTLQGNGTLTAQIMAYEQLDPQLGGAEMGLMVRNGTGERDAFASVSLTQEGGFYFSNRPYENWSVDRIQSYGNEASVPNVYLQLRKVGNRVYAYRSADNVSWFEVGEAALELEGSFELGFFIRSGHEDYYARGAVQILELLLDSDADGLMDSVDANPNNPDADGDGIPDGQEYLLGTDALTANIDTTQAPVSIYSFDVLGYASVTTDSEWEVDNGALYTQDIGAWVEYDIPGSTEGMYRLAIELQQNTASESQDYGIEVSVNGVAFDQSTLELVGIEAQTVEIYLPYLGAQAEPHKLRIKWVSGQPRSALQINSVELEDPVRLGGDAQDWRKLRSEHYSDLDETAVSSKVSPYSLEGKTLFLPSLEISGYKKNTPATTIDTPLAYPTTKGAYYSNIPLFEDDTTVIEISDQGGFESYSKEITWEATNIVDGEQIVLRSVDSLLLMADDGDGTSLEDVDLNFYNDATGELVDSLVSTGGSPNESSKIQYVFEREIASLTVDTYRVEAVIGGTAHSMWVEVVDVDFGGAPSTVLGFQREWTPVSLPSEVELETDSTISLVES